MEMKRVRDHLCSIEEGYVRCFFIEGERAALVVDGGVEAGLRERVTQQTDKPVTFLLTHSDPDHMAACDEFDKILLHPSEMARFMQRNVKILQLLTEEK